MKPYRSYYYEDLDEGASFESARRTITETDLVHFAMLSSDWNPVHTDALLAQSSPFGQRIVHGALGLSIATGLVQRTGMFEESAVALLGYDGWRFDRPLFVGDTVFSVVRVLGKRLTSKGDRGIVNREIQLINQHNEVVQGGRSDFMVWCRAAKSVSNEGK